MEILRIFSKQKTQAKFNVFPFFGFSAKILVVFAWDSSRKRFLRFLKKFSTKILFLLWKVMMIEGPLEFVSIQDEGAKNPLFFSLDSSRFSGFPFNGEAGNKNRGIQPDHHCLLSEILQFSLLERSPRVMLSLEPDKKRGPRRRRRIEIVQTIALGSSGFYDSFAYSSFRGFVLLIILVLIIIVACSRVQTFIHSFVCSCLFAWMFLRSCQAQTGQ